MKVGQFQVELVYAETKVKFQEHVHPESQTVYAEVEPDADYFIRLRNNNKDPVVARVSIDGKPLEVDVAGLTKASGDYIYGLFSRDGLGGETKKAFQFAKSWVMRPEDRKDTPMWTGSVDVSFYEARYEYTGYRDGWGSAFQCTFGDSRNDVGFMIGKIDPDKKKGVMSVEGSFRRAQSDNAILWVQS